MLRSIHDPILLGGISDNIRQRNVDKPPVTVPVPVRAHYLAYSTGYNIISVYSNPCFLGGRYSFTGADARTRNHGIRKRSLLAPLTAISGV